MRLQRLKAAVEWLERAVASTAPAERRDVAERQREACAKHVEACGWKGLVAKDIRAAPLVTEGEP